jgi:hypothetical protein
MSDNALDPTQGKKFVQWKPYKTVDQFMAAKSYLNGDVENERRQEARAMFIEYLMYPQFHLMSFADRGDVLGVNESTVRKWWKECPDDYMAEALKVMREKSARDSLEVDAALKREATVEGGDAKHKELYYRRIEGWVPKQDMELTRGRDKELDGKANFDLLRELVKGLSPEERRQLIGEVPQGAIEANVERLEGGGDA